MSDIQIHATFDVNGVPTGFYPTDIFQDTEDGRNPGIPSSAVSITLEVYQELLAYPGARQYVNGAVQPYAAPAVAVVPESLSRMQFMQQCVLNGDVTWDEAKAFVSTGTIPEKMQTAFSKIPDGQRDAAEFRFLSATTFNRHDPETETLGQLMGKTDAELDDLWTKGALL